MGLAPSGSSAATATQNAEKISFFDMDGNKYAYTVLLLGLGNMPPFYMMFIRVLQDKATLLFYLLCNQEDVALKPKVSGQPLFIAYPCHACKTMAVTVKTLSSWT